MSPSHLLHVSPGAISEDLNLDETSDADEELSNSMSNEHTDEVQRISSEILGDEATSSITRSHPWTKGVRVEQSSTDTLVLDTSPQIENMNLSTDDTQSFGLESSSQAPREQDQADTTDAIADEDTTEEQCESVRIKYKMLIESLKFGFKSLKQLAMDFDIEDHWVCKETPGDTGITTEL